MRFFLDAQFDGFCGARISWLARRNRRSGDRSMSFIA